MTIGIAATGPWAGAGILAGLRAVEAVCRGAIGGFVSLAVLTEDQTLLRAETQAGGTGHLFDGPASETLLRAPHAALISSGPDRPAPLSQFVAAAPGVGIVTGHRFPHVTAEGGQPLNAMVLGAMRDGTAPQTAIDALVAQHPGFDAGFIALSVDGRLGLGNMPSVLRRADQGGAVAQCLEAGAHVATLHNAIHPHRPVAALVNEVVLDEMRRRDTTIHPISVSAGVALGHGPFAEIHVDRGGATVSILHPDADDAAGKRSFGLGDRVRVVRLGQTMGWLGHEPFMVIEAGRIISLDGKTSIELPVLSHRLRETGT